MKDIFHKQRFFLDQGIFPQIFTVIKKMFYSQKSFLLTKIFDPFHTKSYAKIFLTLDACG